MIQTPTTLSDKPSRMLKVWRFTDASVQVQGGFATVWDLEHAKQEGKQEHIAEVLSPGQTTTQL